MAMCPDIMMLDASPGASLDGPEHDEVKRWKNGWRLWLRVWLWSRWEPSEGLQDIELDLGRRSRAQYDIRIG